MKVAVSVRKRGSCKLNTQHNSGRRQSTFHIVDTSRLKVGKNLIMNRFAILNDSIEHDSFLKSQDSYKIICKARFLSFT